ncbi:MAG: choice-of-anchor R domain-containing protein [Planctomycetota bacterium]
MKTKSQVAISFLMLAGAAGAANASIELIGNLTTDPLEFKTGGIDDVQIKAVSFTLPVGDDYGFRSLTVALDDAGPGKTFFGRIVTAGGQNPGTTVLSTVTINDPVNGYNTATPDTPFTFVGGETYWLIFAAGPDDNLILTGGEPDITPTGIATFGSYRLFRQFTPTFGRWNNSTAFNAFSIDVVPTPAAATLLAMGGIAASRRRR